MEISGLPPLCRGLGLDSVWPEDLWGYCRVSILASSWTQISQNSFLIFFVLLGNCLRVTWAWKGQMALGILADARSPGMVTCAWSVSVVHKMNF